MVRLTELTETGREAAESLDCPEFEVTPWVADNKSLSQRVTTLISTAGLIQPGEITFKGGDASYRTIADDIDDNKLTCSHVSVNFDRTGLQRDMNVVLPRQRLRELVAEGVIGASASSHYTFMGATDPVLMESNARELAQTLLADGVDSAVLAPV